MKTSLFCLYGQCCENGGLGSVGNTLAYTVTAGVQDSDRWTVESILLICHSPSPLVLACSPFWALFSRYQVSWCWTKYKHFRWLSRLHVCLNHQLYLLLFLTVPPYTPIYTTSPGLWCYSPYSEWHLLSLASSSSGQFSLSFKTCPRCYLLQSFLPWVCGPGFAQESSKISRTYQEDAFV